MILYLLACFALAAAHPSPLSITHPMHANHNEENRIVGGAQASLGEFPWQVSLQQLGQRHFCGGSLISAGYVMSAAHCYVSVGAHAALGALDYRNPEQLIPQRVFTPHPQYNSTTCDYDYAVITLASPATLGGNVNTIKLAASGKEYSGIASISGWGYTTQTDQSASILLHKSDIPLVSKQTCQSIWGSVIDITNQMQCAGGDGQISTCTGDSGGPLTVQDNGETILIGAVSWFQSNCSPNYPGGYAKISAVRSWIDSIIN